MIKLRRLSAWAGAIAALGLCAAEARADYEVQVTSTAILPAPPGLTSGANGNTVTVTSFLDLPSDLTLATNPADATSQAFGSTALGDPKTPSDAFSIPINFSLVFTDNAGAGTVTLFVKGTLAGNVGPGDDSLAFTNGPGSDLADPTASPATSVYTSFMLDGHQVFVALTAYTPPGNPPTSGPVHDFAVYLYSPVPEPSTIALLGVGGLLLVAPKLRRRVRRLADSK